MINFVVNSDSINYEVAIEILGQSRAPLMTAIRLEKEKNNPSETFIKYCKARLNLIADLQEDLTLSDIDTIRKILDKDGRGVWL